MRIYQNYHKHSNYTNVRIADSAVSQKDYAERALQLNSSILSSCEHGWQGNYRETVKLAKQVGLKPLVSSEAYWVRDRFEKDRSNCHIFIGAKNENGRQALNDALSEANITGFYGQPRLDIPLILSLPKNDVIVTTACIGYWRYEDADLITEQFAKHFGKNFFLEVQYHDTESQRLLNKKILQLHNELKIPLIMGCDSHFIYPEQAQIRTDFLYSKGLTYPEEEGWFLDYPDGDTAYERFANQCVLSHEEIVDAMDNTNVFTEIEEYDSPIFNEDIKMPSIYPELTQEQKDEEYKKLIWSGWNEYKKEIPEDQHKKYIQEIEKEVKTVIDTHTSDYFLINNKVMSEAKKNGGWLTRSGRGSAVSFFTNKLLGFTEVDRVAAKVHMYPERFMSTERILQSGSLPDIDFNVANVDVFSQAQKTVLGEEHSYPMLAYGTMQKSAAWKLYAKSQDISFEIANAVSDQLKRYEKAVKHAPEDEKDYILIDDYISKEFKPIYEKSKDYLGLITSWSIHPCSYLLYQGNIRREIGLTKIKDNLCCLMDGKWAEECHFLKNDLLKVNVVDMIYRIYHRIGKEPPSVNELLGMCPPDDPAWTIYERGCTLGINQCEQPGTSSRVMKYSPKNISELGAFVAAIRPGFKSMYKTFETRQPFEYGVKAFDDLIKTDEMPNSFLLYQEQEMAALNYAGISMSDCYTAIKNIAKKRTEKVLAYKETFINGFRKAMIEQEGKAEDEANELSNMLWQIIEDSASYSFNASHSYCVALDSLYGAWLKAHHPIEFYEVAINLAEKKGDKDKMNALKEEAESYFGIKFPPFRFGQDNRELKGNPYTKVITNSIGSIKGFGKTIGGILYQCSCQSNESFIDVLDCLDKKGIKSSKVKPLVFIDYFQEFGNSKVLTMLVDAWDLFKQGDSKIMKPSSIECEYLKQAAYKTLSQSDISPKTGNMRVDGKVIEILKNYETLLIKEIDIEDFPIQEKIKKSIEILGYADVATGKEKDRKRLLITEVTPISSPSNNQVWAYRVSTKSLGTGKTARITVKTALFEKQPFKEGDVLYANDVWKNQSGYWYLQSYVKES